MKFDEIKCFEQCKLAFSVKEKLLPSPIWEMFDQPGKENNTDTKQDLKISQISRNIKVRIITIVSYAKV